MNTITRMWLDIMRSGALFAGESVEDDDAKFWILHQKEITFAFGVLFSLRLVKDDVEGDGTEWLPTKQMQRLYQKHCRHKRCNLCDDDALLYRRVEELLASHLQGRTSRSKIAKAK